MPVLADFQYPWVIGVSYLNLLCDQHNLPTLRSVSGVMCSRDFPFEHPAQYWQSGCQKKLCFSASHFWDSSNSFMSCWYLSWSVTGLASFASLTAEIMGLSLSLPGCFLPETSGRTFLPGYGVKHIFHILSFLDWCKGYCKNNLLFNLFKNLLLFRTPLDWEDLQSDFNLEYASSKKS